MKPAKRKTADEYLAEAEGGTAAPKTADDYLAEAEAAEQPRGRENPGARRIAEQQLAEGDGEEIKMTPIPGRPAPMDRAQAQARQFSPDRAQTAYMAASNIMSGGLASKIRDTYPEGETFAPADRAAREKREPGSAALGKGLGYGLSAARGPAKIVDAGARGLVGAVAPWLARSAAGRTVAAGAAGAASGAIQGEAIEGQGKAGAIAGGVLGGGLQAGAEVARAGGNWIRNAAPWVRRFDDAAQDGRMARVEAEAAAGQLPDGPPGQFRAGARARDEILARDEALAGQEQQAYREAVDPHLARPGDRMAVERSLLARGMENRVGGGGEVLDPQLQAELGRVRQLIGREPTIEDLLSVRRSLREQAAFGSPNPTDRQVGVRGAYGAVRQGVREASPEVAAADDAFANAQRSRARRNDILFGNEQGGREVRLADDALPAPGDRPAMRVGDERKAAVKLGRLGEEGVEGARAEDELAELAAQDPEFARIMQDLEARKAFLATRFGLSNQTPTNLNKAVNVPLQFLRQNANAVGARAALPVARAASRGGASASSRAGTGASILAPFGKRKRDKKKAVAE